MERNLKILIGVAFTILLVSNVYFISYWHSKEYPYGKIYVDDVETITYSFFDFYSHKPYGITFNSGKGNHFRIIDLNVRNKLISELDEWDVNYESVIERLPHNYFDLEVFYINDSADFDFEIIYYTEDYEYCDAECYSVKEKIVDDFRICSKHFN